MNILDFGAKRGEFCGDAIQRAIDAAAVQGGGRVVVPAGEYETASLILRSNVELHLKRAPCCASSMILTHIPS
ncbi:MAG: hypothetical protein ACLUI3_13085 [Christensenellales bacterium]